MKKPLSPVLCCLLSLLGHAQYKQEKLTYIDESGSRVKEKNAYQLRQVLQIDDTLWEINLYKIDGPRISSIQSTTADGALRNGISISYDARGAADTVGYYDHGEREGYWVLRKDKRYLGQLYYEHDKLIWQKDSARLHQEWLSDSAKAIAAGKPNVFKESSYPGGAAGWLKYLNTHLRYPNEAVNKQLQGEVRIEFRVDQQGELKDEPLEVIRSVAYSLDKESLRIIYESGQWDPAVKFGNKVKSWKIQPVVYRLAR